MSDKKIIAICGLAGAGKDTIADYIIKSVKERNPELKINKMAFADKLKDMISVLFNLDRNMLAGFTKEAREEREKVLPKWSKRLGKDVTPRTLMQEIGTELLRDQFYSDIWVACLEDTMETSNNDIIIITDCRYVNEINLLESLGANFIEVIRDEPLWVDDFVKTGNIPANIHQSERNWIKPIKAMTLNKYTIMNKSSLSDLYNSIDNIYQDLITK